MAFFDKIKGLFNKEPKQKKQVEVDPNRVSVPNMERKFEADDLVGAAKDLKSLLEIYGRKKRKNHRYKGREFIYFILSHKHKGLKNTGYTHWQNLGQIIRLNQQKVYPYHKNNLRSAMDFFKSEIRAINEIDVAQN